MKTKENIGFSLFVYTKSEVVSKYKEDDKTVR